MNEKEILDIIFESRIKLAIDNFLSIPQRYFLSDNKKVAYMEIENNKILIMAIKRNNGEWVI